MPFIEQVIEKNGQDAGEEKQPKKAKDKINLLPLGGFSPERALLSGYKIHHCFPSGWSAFVSSKDSSVLSTVQNQNRDSAADTRNLEGAPGPLAWRPGPITQTPGRVLFPLLTSKTPWWSMVKTLALPMTEARVRFLVRKLRSDKPRDAAEKINT